MSFRRKILQVSLPLAILGIAGGGAFALVNSAPKPAEAKVEPPKAPLVDVATVNFQDHPFTIRSQGVVNPLTQTMLTSEVSGRVISVSPAFVSGGLVKKGDVLVTIERGDYESALRSAEANLARAEATLTEEIARGQVAEAEWKKRGLKNATDLALRKPQLAREQANVKAAKADLERAKRNLSRTQIRAPYDALVRSKQVDIGQSVGQGSVIGELNDISMAEVRLPMLRSELAMLELPQLGEQRNISQLPKVRLSTKVGNQVQQWDGVIRRSENVIDQNNRMIYVVAQVIDPYGLGQPREHALQFGSFVEAHIEAPVLSQVARIPRELLRTDSNLVLVDDNSQLELREVTPVRQDAQFIYVRDQLSQGEQVVLNPLENPFNGMPVSRNQTVLAVAE